MRRSARIMTELEAAHEVSAEELAAVLNVGRRTVANEISAIQESLGSAASITFDKGRYRLLIADPSRYTTLRAGLVSAVQSFNEPDVRATHIVARLFRARMPVRIDEFAREMSVGRSTIVTDLGRLRDELASTGLRIEGRPKVGLSLHGPELQQRLLILRQHFEHTYPDSDEQRGIRKAVTRVIDRAGIGQGIAGQVARWAEVAVDRARRGHTLRHLPTRYRGLTGSPEHRVATCLTKDLSAMTGVTLDGGEAVFLALPVASCRAPHMTTVPAVDGADSGRLVTHVLDAINSQMEIDLSGSHFLPEFARHLALMVNRMRYLMWVDDSMLGDVRHKYPVAHRMAVVAARALEDRLGLPVDPAEVGYLTTYFQVFLEGREPPGALCVVVVSGEGRVAAELVRLQLAKVLPPSAQIEVVSRAEADDLGFDGADLVVVTGDEEPPCEAPVLHVTQVLDRGALERSLRRLTLRLPLRPYVAGGSVLANALDQAHFFALPPGTGYAEAIDYMTGHLEAKGLAENGFGERIRQREAIAQTQLDAWVGFPHATIDADSGVMLAVGVIPRAAHEEGVRLIVLLGVPRGSTHSEEVLVRVYDEVLRLGARRDLVDQLSRLTTFEDFYYFLENNPFAERQR